MSIAITSPTNSNCRVLIHDSFICDMNDSYIHMNRNKVLSIAHTWALLSLWPLTANWECQYMTLSYVWHDLFICMTWRVHMCDMTDSYAWYDSRICGTWLIHMCDMLTHMCATTRSCVWHDPFTCLTWPIICVWHDSLICVIWRFHMFVSLALHYCYGVARVSRIKLYYRSLLQNIVSFIGLFCKRDL